MAVFLASMEQLLSDFLWSNYYPVNASITSISQELVMVWLNFGFVLFFSALHVSKRERRWTLSSLASLILLVMGAHVFVNQLHCRNFRKIGVAHKHSTVSEGTA